MRTRRSRSIAALAMATGLLLAACGDNDSASTADESTADTTAAADATATVDTTADASAKIAGGSGNDCAAEIGRAHV